MISDMGALTSLIRGIGSNQFDQDFYKFSRSLLHIDKCSVFHFSSDHEPQCLLAEAEERQSRQLMRWLAAEYSQEGYLSDPTLRTAANTPNSRLKVTRVSPSAISDNAYRQRFYADAHIGEELAMTFLQRGQGLYFCFFRSEDKVKFAKQDASQLRRVGAFLSEVFSKHMEVLGIRSNTHKEQLIALAGPEDRQRKFQGMLNTLQSYPCELSQREAEICAMIALGYTSQGIGLNLGISINTVGTHRKRAYMKLGISSQAELFAYLLKLHSNVPALPA